ncbi:hypothetical protein NDK47_19625 [Brevibacillus ruminantium]|uniref:DUF4282 domain-containing protein n=1 Tax=Brevibacillus ruminantium TaxID=2950604 RepID=A0ABY4WC84_9BACL|nr:hypothetical protein [Brevibacillus ruminantium]USG64349.1 hypothetical protein NDK47_19625 [Brevibacillus ruminantium]
MFRSFFTFGEWTAKQTIRWLFLIGILPIFWYTIEVVQLTSLMFSYTSETFTGTQYMPMRTENYFLGILIGALFYVVAVFFWKLICELLLFIFRSLEVFIQKSEQRD